MGKSSPIWLFDLDDTLHNASHAIFPAISQNMNRYIAGLLGDGTTPADAAIVNAVRQEYWQRYGATLLGLVKHHGVRADEFLHQAHRFDDLTSMIRAERGLARLFKRLPGRKILFTNAPRQYSRLVLRHLGLHRHFAQHIPIEEMRVHGQLQPKPSSRFLRKLLARQGLQARQCILVEDSLANLRAAKKLGIRTVLVTQYAQKNLTVKQNNSAACVDVTVKSVFKLAAQQSRLRSKPHT
ncbi:MAG: pyrimidine 5'-nucleotidase [Pseudomonadota bacterium]